MLYLTDKEIIPARCTDREIRKRIGGEENAAKREGWLCRVVCEFDHDGQNYRATPIVRRKFARVAECDFPSVQEAERFLQDRISPVGDCRLRVNPGNPLEAELC